MELSMLGCLCLSDRIALLLGTEYVEDLCLSDRIILPLGFEYVEQQKPANMLKSQV
jgi:hypothetical protein